MDDCVFTGDALLIRGCDFKTAPPGQLYGSVTKVLFALPDTGVSGARLQWPDNDHDRRRAAL